MKKAFFYLALLWYCKTASAQYTIPGASQQPAWVFPIWFENALGEKDTLYIGYDIEAYNPFGSGIYKDSLFGEKLIKIDTTKFNMQLCGSLIADSVYKVKVNLFNYPDQCGDGSFQIYATQGYLPIKMSWDVTLLRSDSLPFADQFPAPRAEMLIWMGGNAGDSTGSCFSWGDNPVLATDTVAINGGALAACVREDSIIFTALSSLKVEIRPWNGKWLSIEEGSISTSDVDIYPNPFSDKAMLTVTGITKYMGYNFAIYDLLGQRVKSFMVTSHRTEIYRGSLAPGIYMWTLTGKDMCRSGKIILR